LRFFKGKIPVYFRGDSNLLDETKNFKQLARRIFLRWVYRYVDRVFYVGHNNKQYFKAHGIKENQLIFAPHAIDNERFTSAGLRAEKEAADWRTSLGISARDVVFLFSGKLEPKKDPTLLLQAFIELNHKQTHLIFVGNGVLESQLKQTASSYTNVHFIDFQNQSQMPEIYRLGDVFVLPSKGPGETWGLAVNEAMACGRPVIVSNKVGCAADLVHQNSNGYIITSGLQKELTKTMREMVSDTAKLKSMGELSLQIIQQWSIPVMVERMKKAILNF
jgi:glycosyltransferase involved in cell wall biosynthesis